MNTSRNRITGIVLAGGESKRFGSDKAIYDFQGKSMLKHSIDLLQSFCHQIYVSGDRDEYSRYGYSCVPDRYLDHGPLSGIATLLEESTTTQNLVVTCDMPLVNEKIVALLLDAHQANTITIFSYLGHDFYFPMVIDKSYEKILRGIIVRGNQNIATLFAENDVVKVEINVDDLHCLTNINEKSDIPTDD